jgi:hypothetical protein
MFRCALDEATNVGQVEANDLDYGL